MKTIGQLRGLGERNVADFVMLEAMSSLTSRTWYLSVWGMRLSTWAIFSDLVLRIIATNFPLRPLTSRELINVYNSPLGQASLINGQARRHILWIKQKS
jgi:hypothetical protein